MATTAEASDLVVTEETAVTPSISPSQVELINYLASLADLLSLPRSAGQIYGLLFGQPSPVAFDEIVALLGISKGSASGSLKLLKRLSAIQPRHQLGDRRTFYEAETRVSHLVQSFLENGVNSHLKESESQLQAVSVLVSGEKEKYADSATPALLTKRISSLQTWHQRARKLLPSIGRLTLPPKGGDD